MQRIIVKNIVSQKINVQNKTIQKVKLGNAHEIILGGDLYEGGYVFTPTRELQTVLTADKLLIENVIINPIPQNYGLITYNGFEIMVS